MELDILLGRIYSFSAAHRLHSARLSEDENKILYDKCNNYYGHGHDYKLEVTLKGPVNPETGMIIPLPVVDHVVNDLIKKLDHKHLNYEVPFFKNNIPTGEVIVHYLWDELNKKIENGLLYHLKLWETNNNYFEIKRSADK